MENYLCFRMNESFFLLPLAMVVWILPGNQNNLPEEWENEVVVRICCPEIGTQESSVYRILFQDSGACAEICADQIPGVVELSAERMLLVPDTVKGNENICLSRVTFVKEIQGWAFLLDTAMWVRMGKEFGDEE